MAKSKSPEIVNEAPMPTVWQPPVAPDTLALELHDRTLNLNVAGHRRMQISLDPVELGVGEMSLALPGIKLRIAL